MPMMQTAHRYQALAAVPKEIFEAALADPEIKPSTVALIRQGLARYTRGNASAE